VRTQPGRWFGEREVRSEQEGLLHARKANSAPLSPRGKPR
jgi:hypothetical protein